MNHWTAPRRCDVAPWAVTQFPEHAADEKAASARYHQAAEAASEFQGDEPADDFDFARGLLLAIAVTAVLASIVVVLL